MTFRTTLIALVLTACALAQTPITSNPDPLAPYAPKEYLGLGPGYANNPNGRWTMQGFYEKQIASNPDIFSFTEYDALAQSFKPFNVQTSMRTGFDYRCFQIQFGNYKIYSMVGVDLGGGSTGQSANLSFGGTGKILFPIKTWIAPVTNMTNTIGIYVGVSGLKNSATDPAVLWKWGIYYAR